MNDQRILQTGRNCYRIQRADKVAFLIDGEAYFKALYQSLPLAEQQIMILAWDIYSRLKLIPSQDNEKQSESVFLGKLLDQLVRQKRDLHVNILSWDFSLLFALSREWLPIYKLDWTTHRRLKFCLDDQYPIGSSHHQKVVVLDDSLAFAGGLDLTRGRWDTPEHRNDDLRRQDVDGDPLPIQPYHDVQVAVSGQAAAALGDLARERWWRGTNKKLPVPERSNTQLWPAELLPDIENVDVAIVRTEPAFADFTEVREVEQLYLDAIAAAQNYIYIENQYFTAISIGEALASRLAEENGPEVIITLPLQTAGWLSQQSMDMMRVKLIKILRKADKYQRFAIYYPDKPDLGEQSINLHAKLMIIDDRFVRVGSANLNNRSMGLDTECDLAIEAPDDDDGRVHRAIGHFRNRLLAEHLACEPEKVEARVKQYGSLVRSVESLRGEGRTLSPLEAQLPEPDERILRDIKLSDPERPVDTDTLLNHFVPQKQIRPASRRVITWLIALFVLIAVALAWRYTPLSNLLDIKMLAEAASQWQQSAVTPLIVIAAFVISGLLIIPVTVMIIVTVLAFGLLPGFFYSLTGGVVSALVGYGFGVLLGRKSVRQLAGSRINEISRRLAKRGLLTMLVVRILPVAPFTIVNLVAGASHIRFYDFLFGNILGLIPGILAITLLTDRVKATLYTPDWLTLVTLVLVALVVFTVGYFLSRRLLVFVKNRTDIES